MGDNQVLQVVNIIEAAGSAQQVTAFAFVDVAGGHIAVTGANGVAHILQAQVALGNPRWVDLNLDLAQGVAHLDLRYSGNPLHARAQVVIDKIADHVHIQIAWVAHLRQHGEIHERIFGKGFAVQARLIDVFGVVGHLAQGIGNPDKRFIGLDSDGEFQLDHGCAHLGEGFHAAEVGQRTQVALLFQQDFFFNILRCRPRPAGFNGDDAGIQVGNHLHRHTQGCCQAEYTYNQHYNAQQAPLKNQFFNHRFGPARWMLGRR